MPGSRVRRTLRPAGVRSPKGPGPRQGSMRTRRISVSGLMVLGRKTIRHREMLLPGRAEPATPGQKAGFIQLSYGSRAMRVTPIRSTRGVRRLRHRSSQWLREVEPIRKRRPASTGCFKSDPKTGKRKNLGTFGSRAPRGTNSHQFFGASVSRSAALSADIHAQSEDDPRRAGRAPRVRNRHGRSARLPEDVVRVARVAAQPSRRTSRRPLHGRVQPAGSGAPPQPRAHVLPRRDRPRPSTRERSDSQPGR